ncbi:unnamed protein product [Prunus armeniaca]
MENSLKNIPHSSDLVAGRRRTRARKFCQKPTVFGLFPAAGAAARGWDAAEPMAGVMAVLT